MTTTTSKDEGQATVQYPESVCQDHEYGSDWPCMGCGK